MKLLMIMKFVPDWYKTQEIVIKLLILASFYFKASRGFWIADDDTHFCNEYFSKVLFYANQIGILSDNNFCEDDLDTIIHVRLLLVKAILKNAK